MESQEIRVWFFICTISLFHCWICLRVYAYVLMLKSLRCIAEFLLFGIFFLPHVLRWSWRVLVLICCACHNVQQRIRSKMLDFWFPKDIQKIISSYTDSSPLFSIHDLPQSILYYDGLF